MCALHTPQSFTCYFSVQIIMVRLQRVTFLALNQFLGLGRELLNQVSISGVVVVVVTCRCWEVGGGGEGEQETLAVVLGMHGQSMRGGPKDSAWTCCVECTGMSFACVAEGYVLLDILQMIAERKCATM